MNLLHDKREDERPAEMTPDSFLSDDQPQKAGRNEVEPAGAARPRNSKNTLGTLLIAAAIFIAAILITYFGFYKPKEGAERAKVTPNAQIDSTTESVRDTQSTTPADQVEQKGETAMSSDAVASLSAASDLMQMIQNSLGTGRVTAFFLDEGSFSAEVDAGSVEEARRTFNAVKSSLPAQVQLTSSSPNTTNALVTGTFNARTTSQPTGVSASQAEQELRQIASESGTTVSSLTIETSAGEQSFVVMRLNGSFDACRQYVEKLAQKNWNVSVSKFILMPGPTADYTFVLRFYI